jgi:uncharacterized cupredoxin-like copper-binding protein
VAHWIENAVATAGRRLAYGVAGLSLTLLALAGCGGSSQPSASSGTSSAESSAAGTSSAPETASKTVGSDGALTATEADFSISLGSTVLAAGPYRIKVENKGTATHDLAVEQNGTKIAATSSVAPGASTMLVVTLKPGTYVFYCSIGNHRSMGMQVTVHVS